MAGLVKNKPILLTSDLIGKGYDDFWNADCRYVVVKGSRASKKSYTIAYKIIIGMMQNRDINVLVARKTEKSLKDSCFTMLQKIIYRMGYQKYWKMSVSPLEMVYRKTGQKILFRGLDDVQKLSSVTVTNGVLCWAWVEEAYQIKLESDFDLIDQAIRGATPPGVHKQIFVSFNPWNKSHWLRTKFFETEDGEPLIDKDIFAITTNYMINEWLDEADKIFFERMKKLNPTLYKVAGLGEWGNPEGLIYNNWEESDFDIDLVKHIPGIQAIFGCDFGFSLDPSAFIFALVDKSAYKIYIVEELYETGLTTRALAGRIKDMGYAKETIICDSAQPMDIWELQNYYNIGGAISAYKFPGSILSGIQNLQNYTIVIPSWCKNFLMEIQAYSWYVDNNGVTQDKPDPYALDHLLDALRYAMQSLDQGGGMLLGGPDEEDLSKLYPNPTDDEKDKKDDDDDDDSLCFAI